MESKTKNNVHGSFIFADFRTRQHESALGCSRVEVLGIAPLFTDSITFLLILFIFHGPSIGGVSLALGSLGISSSMEGQK